MSVVVVSGSPRETSNAGLLAEVAVKAIGAQGSEVKKFVINELAAKGCQACYSCKGKTEFCAIKDDLTHALSSVTNADYVIFVTPIYIGEITAQAKIFVDRCYSLFKPDFKTNPAPGRLAPGKKFLLIFTQGNPDATIYQKNLQSYLGYFKRLGFQLVEGVVAAGLAKESVLETRPDLVKKVEDAAKSLLQG
ncbi:MAG: flavodoxin family protein [Deltaproteobacteria bacterium]|jgi:multimeric flavodoxin WrbA|nr:flavodoxin family protein [Deltaproteobacteria bacterium]